MSNFPPKPVLAMTIGVTGHRLYRHVNGSPSERVRAFDPIALRKTVDHVLAQLKKAIEDSRASYSDLFDEAEPVITVVSALAEGADRIVAEAALACGMPLDVVLPRPRAEYEATFEDDASRAEFAKLLAASRARLILPAPPAPAPSLKKDADGEWERAYEIGGLTILGQADILLAVWDGEPARGRGGTGGIVDEAARQGAPIIVIDPAGAPPHLRWHASRQFPLSAQHAIDLPRADLEEGLGTVIRGLVGPPESEEELEGLKHYYRSPLANSRRKASSKSHGGEANDSNQRVMARLTEIFAAADDVAGKCALAFRSTYRLNFIFGFLAVVAVTGSIAGPMILHARGASESAGHAVGAVCAALEIIFVLLIGVAAHVAERHEWHRRWAEAREVAERLRVAEPFWMMGVWPHNLANYQPAWTGWYMRAVLREQPVYSVDEVINVREAKRVLREKLEDQKDYYARTGRRMKRRDLLLKKGGRILIVVSLLVAAAEVFFTLADTKIEDITRAAMLTISILLPALATTFFGARLVADTEDIARRAARSSEILGALEARLSEDLDDLQILRGRARAAAAAMLADVASWRIALQSRSIPDG